MFKTILAATLISIGLGTLFAQEEPRQHQDTSTGLPKEYADYLIASSTLSPDEKFAVIYPKAKLCPDEPKKGSAVRCKNYLVALKPFQVLTVLDTKWAGVRTQEPRWSERHLVEGRFGCAGHAGWQMGPR